MTRYQDIYDEIAEENRKDAADPTRPLRREQRELLAEKKRIKKRLKQIEKELFDLS